MRKIFSSLTILLFLFVLIACGSKTAEVIDEIELIFDGGDTISNITQDFKVTVTSSNEDATIRWESSEPNTIKIVGDNAVVTRQPQSTQVTLTVTITIGRNSEFKDFIVTVSAAEIKTFTVKFNTEGEVTYEDQSVNEGTKAYSPGTPTKEGYTFSGWYLGDVLFDFDTPVTSDISLDAKFLVNKNKLTYRVDGKTHKEETYEYGEEIEILDDLEKLGYKFDWNQTLPDLMPDHDIDVNGTFTINTYKITYTNYEGNHNNRTVYNVTDDFDLNLPPPKAGYTALGWFLDDINITKIEEGMTGDITLEARYTINSYKVIYNVDGELYKEEIYDYNESIESLVADQGYQFVYSIEIPEKMPNYDLIVSVTIDPIKYSITYNNIDVINPNPNTYSILDELILKDPTKTGYTFNGWYLNGDLFTEIEIGSTGDITLEASFTINTYKITIDTDGGVPIDPFTFEFDSLIELPTPIKEGYTFLYWSSSLPEKMPAVDLSIKAVYQINSYVVSFNEHVTVKASSLMVENGSTVEWNTALNITINFNEDNQYIGSIKVNDVDLEHTNKDFEITIKEDLDITALIVDIGSHLVKFETSGGSLIEDVSIKEGELLTKPVDPTKEGYTFLGWFKESEHINEFDFTTELINEPVVLFAEWEIKTFEIILPLTIESDQPYNAYVEYGSDVLLTINIPVGYEIESLFLNGSDVTKDIINNNEYIIETINEDILVEINYKLEPEEAFVKNSDRVTTARADGELLNEFLLDLPSDVNVYYNRNGATTHSILNNTAQQIRLYPGNTNGGGLTISVDAKYLINKLVVDIGDTNAGFSINGDGNYTYTDEVKEISITPKSDVIIKNIVGATSGSDNQVRINSITVYYVVNDGDIIDDEAPVLTFNDDGLKVFALGDEFNIEEALLWVNAVDNVDDNVLVELDLELSLTEDNKFNLVGEYNLIYYAYDEAGNYAELVITVFVFETLDGLLESINYSGFNDYYTELNISSDIVTDMAWLLRNTIEYQTYGDARYVFVPYTNFPNRQVILYDYSSSNSYRKVPFDWGDGGKITLDDQSTLTVDREHVWSNSNMRIMPVNGLTSNSGYVGFKINDGTDFDYSPNNNRRGHYSDFHNLWLADSSTNRSRGNSFFGEENGSSNEPYLMNQIFYPGDEYKGDVARIMFYMTLMYPHLTLVDKGSGFGTGTVYQGYLDVLLRWNEEDPVSDYEIARNELIYTKQGNRNPFVDFYDEGFAEMLFIFGDPEVVDDNNRIIS